MFVAGKKETENETRDKWREMLSSGTGTLITCKDLELYVPNAKELKDKIEVDLDDLQTQVARLVINTQRRTAGREDYNELARFLRKNEPGEKSYLVKSGSTIAERISELTGIHPHTVRTYIDLEFKQSQEKVDIPSTLGPTERVYVPQAIAKPVQEAVEEVDVPQAEPGGSLVR